MFATGLLRNLNHIYAGNNTPSWAGFVVFGILMVPLVVAWVADFADVAGGYGGYGGYNADHEFFGYRQSI